jgi:putative FmdB family regulatory protein
LPIYEYRCRQCGEQFEKIQKFTDPLLTTCGSCGGELERLLSPPALQFKGSGWYVTDYARKGASEKTPSDSATAKSKKKEGESSGVTQTTPAKSSPEE